MSDARNSATSAGGTGDISPWTSQNLPPEEVVEAFEKLVRQQRRLQDALTASRGSTELFDRVTRLLAEATALLDSVSTDERRQIAGKMVQFAGRSQSLIPAVFYEVSEPDRVAGHVTFSRFYLGGGGAAHGGTQPLVFDELLGRLAGAGGRPRSRTAYLHVNYRVVTPLDRPLAFEAQVQRQEGRKLFVTGSLRDGDTLLADAEGLFVTLKPGQP